MQPKHLLFKIQILQDQGLENFHIIVKFHFWKRQKFGSSFAGE